MALNFSLRHLQAHQPWTVPYSTEFAASRDVNPHRQLAHDVLHIMKSLGRIAGECEHADHGRPTKLTREQLADEVSDLVICALHIAGRNNFSLNDAVIEKIERINRIKLPPE